MDIKNTKAMINKSGNGYINVKVMIPNEWANKLGITDENRDLSMSFDGMQILISKASDDKCPQMESDYCKLECPLRKVS